MTPEDRRQSLDRFIATKKFVKEPFYLVDLDEADRLQYEAWVNQLARSLRQLPPSRQTKPVVLGMFRPVMKKFDTAEVEDQDRFIGYLEELMDIFGIESLDGLLDTWRNGQDMTAQTKANAEETLRSLLGAPVRESDVGPVWSLTTPDRTSTLSLVKRWGSVAFIWQVRGFTYARWL